MFRPAASFLVSLFFVCCSFPQTPNQGATIRLNVDLVSVNARVTDKQGHDVPGLTADDFSLFEDRRKQEISFFDGEKEPIALSILVDSSSSMNAGAKLGAAQGMLEDLIGRARLEDEVSVLQFTDHIVGFRQITREQRLLVLPAGITSASGGTALYGAVATALCHLRTSKNPRQAIVVITDGADQHSRLKLEQLIRLVQSSRAQLFIIGFYRGPDYEIYKQSDKTVTLVTGREIDNPLIVFDRLARESGAEAFFPITRKSFAQAVNDISNILRSQYTLSYYPEGNANSLRRIQIRLNRSGLKIRARESIGWKDPAGESVQFDADSCTVSAKAYPFPYESRVTKSGDSLDYKEDFADPRTGWPNRAGSRYVSNGYELYFDLPKHKDNQILLDTGPIGIGALAAYGPWWGDFRASVYVDVGWAKMRSPPQTLSLKSQNIFNSASAGIVFRVNDGGYYAFLLSTSPQAYKADELSFKLVKKPFQPFSEESIIPWTRIPAKQVQHDIAPGIKLTVECHGDQITLFVDDQQVGHVRDTTYGDGYVGLATVGTEHATFRTLRVEGAP